MNIPFETQASRMKYLSEARGSRKLTRERGRGISELNRQAQTKAIAIIFLLDIPRGSSSVGSYSANSTETL